MDTNHHSQPSFSRGQRWRIGLSVFLSVLSVASIVAMANYLAARHFRIWDVTAEGRSHLGPLTLRVLGALTNRVDVIVFFDHSSRIFSSVNTLIDQMKNRCPQLEIEFVDYIRFPARAEKLRAEFNLMPDDTGDRVIFRGNGETRTVYARDLSEYDYSELMSKREIKRVGFKGEQLFASALYGLIDPRSVNIYFLEGHGERDPENTEDQTGYSRFAESLAESGVTIKTLSLLTNAIPDDCRLLAVANPSSPIALGEIRKIEDYLNRGGRLLALFSYDSVLRPPTGLEKLLEKWDVKVGANSVVDRAQGNLDSGDALVIEKFGNHSIVQPLHRSRLFMATPRSVEPAGTTNHEGEAPKASPLAFTGPEGIAIAKDGNTERAGAISVAVAVEKKVVNPADSDLDSTRIVAVGESLFLANVAIDKLANRDFGRLAVNWLLRRDVLLAGIGPRAIKEFSITMTQTEMRTMRWLFMGVVPGGVFFVGCLVWYRRRF
ncbi:MAG: GldG family protein [Verrucomicrobia bacterium]|nr:GldG family protein [Verrucomicrobiota bacterium]